MPRRPRLRLAGTTSHIVKRGNNRTACFFAETDYAVFIALLNEHARRTGCQVHAYVLMSNHFHLLATASAQDGLSEMMKGLGQGYVHYVNRRHSRTGTLWEGRFHSSLIDDERYALACQRYVELNPVRAHIVSNPANYQWSSYASNALGAPNSLLTPHLTYQQLGKDAQERQTAYRELFETELPSEIIEQIRYRTAGNYALGQQAFVNDIEAESGLRSRPGHAGRPRRQQ